MKITLARATEIAYDKCKDSKIGCVHANQTTGLDMTAIGREIIEGLAMSLSRDEDLVRLGLRLLWMGIHIGIAWEKGEPDAKSK